MQFFFITLFILIILVVILVFAVSSKCEDALCHPKAHSKEHEFEVIPKFGYDLKKTYDSLDLEEFELTVPNGYEIRGSVIRAEKDHSFTDGKERAVILVHGVTANSYTMLAQAEVWHRLGFNVIIYDQPAHGESGGGRCTMGYEESEDLVFIAEEMRKRFPEGTIFGMGGESMGAATVMMAAPKLPWMSFVYEDGGYATMRDEVPACLKYKAKLPSFPFSDLTIMYFDKRNEHKIDDIRPIDHVRKIAVPMLFVHGGQDRFVPTENVYKLYEAKEGPKEIKVFENCPHVKACFMEHEEYYKTIKEFCQKYGII